VPAKVVSVALVFVACDAARAAIAWDEIGQGDLSNFFNAPTPVPVELGDNFIYANMGESATGIDRDFFTITVPSGHILASITIDFYFGDDPIGFFGIVLGPSFAVEPDKATPDDVDGYVLFGTAGLNVPGTDVLPRMPLIHEPPRFTVPLGPGRYSFWVQQLDGLADYGLNFVIDVPGPGAFGLCAAVAPMMLVRRRGLGASENGPG
jgi:hypothetical protein